MTNDFNRIYEMYKDNVYTIAYRYLGDPHAALDVSQDVFLALYEKRTKLLHLDHIGPYLYRSTINRAIDNIRKNRTIPMKSHHERADESSPLSQLERQDEVAFLLKGLTPDEKMAVILKDILELKMEEITGLLDIELSAVKSRLFRAREKMRKTGQRRNYG